MELLRILFLFGLPLTLAVGVTCMCRQGWTLIEKHCYLVAEGSYTWMDAESNCNELQAKLSGIETAEYYAHFMLLLSKRHSSRFWLDSYSNLNNRKCVYVSKKTGFTNYHIEDCKSNAGFICKKDIEDEDYFKNITVKTAVSTLSTTLNPPNGTCVQRNDSSIRGNKCYWIHKSSSRDIVEEGCRASGGSLVEINDKEEEEYVSLKFLQLKGDYWLGLKRVRDNLLWDSGSPLDLYTTPWTSGQPSVGSGDCVLAYHETTDREGDERVKWTMELCNASHEGYCEVELQLPSTTTTSKLQHCPPGWKELESSGDCMWVSPTTIAVTWDEAEAYCENIGGNLLFYDVRDDDSISRNLQFFFPPFWIGLRYDIDTFEYKWSSGFISTYRSWKSGMPDTNRMQLLCISLEQLVHVKHWVNRYCNMLKPFICRASKDSAVDSPPPPPTKQPVPVCTMYGSNWFLNEDYCYKYVSDIKSWHQAERFCQDNGGHLTSVLSNNETGFLIRMFRQLKVNSGLRVWFGYNALGLDSEFRWSDDSVVNFVHWDRYQPNNFMSQEKCCNLNIDSGVWHDENCNAKKPFVCKSYNGIATTSTERPSTTPLPGNCPPDWRAFGNKCYLAVGEKESARATWPNAHRNCNSLNSQLVTIHSQEIQNFLNLLLLTLRTNSWIGLHDRIIESEYYWNDNSELDFTFWAKNEPKKSYLSENDCVEIQYDISGNSLGRWNDDSCRDRRAYICEKPKDPNILTPSSEDPTCKKPNGWLSFPDGCYKIFSNPDAESSWLRAESTCQRFGGHLATVRDEGSSTVLKYLSTSMKRFFWIGLKENARNQYEWVGGLPVTYTDWGKNEPNNQTPGKGCVSMSYNGQWQATQCKERRPFACEVISETVIIPRTQSGTICPLDYEGWLDLGGSFCYSFETKKLATWANANHNCFQQGGTLVSIHSEDELNLLAFFIKGSKNSVWIGIARRHNGGFAWFDGSPVDYVNWESNEPSSLREHCTEMYSDSNKWNDQICSAKRGYICMTKKLVPNITVAERQRGYKASEEASILSTGGVAGVVIGCLLVVVLGIAVAITFLCRKEKDTALLSVPQSESMHFENAMFTRYPLGEEDEY